MKRFPVIPTIIVAVAVATMIALGTWQLQRAEWKEGLIARYEAALSMSSEVPWPEPADDEASYFRRATVACSTVGGIDSIGGKSASGQSGWVHIARCALEGGDTANVTMGWSRDPNPPAWQGGAVQGTIVPYGDTVRLLAATPVAGLAPLARPDPHDLPNNHLAYAGQWFFFAFTALVIYLLALRRRRRETA